MKSVQTYESVLTELEELRMQLQEANETIEAIRSGEVDALVVKGENGHQLYTLKSADQTYRVLIEKMKEGAVTLNKDGIILYSNSQFASMVNLPLAEVIGLSFLDFIADASKENFKTLMKQGWQSDSKGEIALVNKNKIPKCCLFSFTSLELDEGQALSIILTDLTELKETETQLKQKNIQLEKARVKVDKMNEELEVMVKERTKDLFLSREYFKFLADNTPVMIWTTDADGKLDYINRQWNEYTGFGVEESRTKQGELIHPDDLEQSLAGWKQALENKQKYEQEFRFKRISDGAFRWHYAQAIPVKDEQGNVTAWVGTSIDIDDQKQELKKKDEFIGIASHELRTPLTSLKGYIQLMESDQTLPDDTKLYIKKAYSSVNKLQHLIEELLDASKIEAGKLKFTKNVFNLTNLVNIALENSAYIYPSYKIKKELEEDIMAFGNEERLEQVLLNLVNNAVKYSPQNKEIIIRAEKNENFAIVSVIDFGIGISQTDQPRIFERFYRAEANKFSSSGLGMGLYISSEIIKEHNGQMVVKSKVNEGSEFSFSIPLADTT